MVLFCSLWMSQPKTCHWRLNSITVKRQPQSIPAPKLFIIYKRVTPGDGNSPTSCHRSKATKKEGIKVSVYLFVLSYWRLPRWNLHNLLSLFVCRSGVFVIAYLFFHVASSWVNLLVCWKGSVQIWHSRQSKKKTLLWKPCVGLLVELSSNTR